MVTARKNLSFYNPDKLPSAKQMKIGIVVSEWNREITQGLEKGATETLLQAGASKSNMIIHYVPGGFELPLGAQWMFESYALDAVICLGCVIQGETKHFDFVCRGITDGIQSLCLKVNKAVIFGVLTDQNRQQSLDRSGGKHGNKGVEAAVSAIKMVALQAKMRN